MENNAEVHIFDNGVKVYRHHLIDEQITRYAEINLHEPEEEKWFLKIIHSRIAPNGIFFDVGAAIGYYAILAKKILPSLEIYVFEPLEMHQAYLRENVQLNGFNANDISLHTEALAEKPGQFEFKEDSFGSVLTSAIPTAPQSLVGTVKTFAWRMRHFKTQVPPSRKPLLVTTTTLDIVAVSLKKPIDLVKVDVQGAELDVLKGAAHCLHSGLVKTWIIGSHSVALHAQCIKLLKDNLYKIVFEQQQVEHQPDGIIIAELG